MFKYVSVIKGMHTLIDGSKERKDTIHICLINIYGIKVHMKCRKIYSIPSNIKAAAINARCAGPSTSQHCLREVKDRFDFKRDCLLYKKMPYMIRNILRGIERRFMRYQP